MTDAASPALLDRFVRGDVDALEGLFRQFEKEVYRWSLRIVREPAAAEDVTAETFWRAWRGRARFDRDRPFGAWLRRIATNAAIDWLKSAARDPSRPTGHALDGVATRDAPTPDHKVHDALTRAFRGLPVRLRVVATLALIEERPHSEIAEALDLPLGTVKSRVFRATRALRAELAKKGIDA
jgi:RNA polymerase sigma-70 factor (ECF subfamily)